MGMPYRGGQRPIMGQEGDTLVCLDRGDLFTQEASRPTRTAYQWEYEDGAVGSGRWVPLQPFGPHNIKREYWDVRLAAEDMVRLKIGREWIGRQFRLQTWGGFGPSPDGPDVWCEWGNADGSHADDLRPSSNSYSVPWMVKQFGDPIIPPGPGPNVDDIKDEMVVLAHTMEQHWRRKGQLHTFTRITLAKRILLTGDEHLSLAERRELSAFLDSKGVPG